jgi:outer membrane autotransporter protein
MSRRKGKSWGIAVLTLAAVLSAVALASADVRFSDRFSELITQILEGGCPQLSPGSSATLAGVCGATAGIPNESASSVSPGTVAVLRPQELLFRRAEELRNGSAGDASSLGNRSGDAATGLGGRLGLFAAYEFERYDKDVTRFESGFESSQHAGIFGIDYRFDSWLLGVAFTVGKVSGEYDAGGGTFFTTYGGPTVYLSFFPIRRLFIDVVGSYIHKDHEFNRNVELFEGVNLIVAGSHRGEPTENEFRFAVNSGYDFSLGSLTIGPRLGLTYAHNEMRGYTENDVSDRDVFSGARTGLELVFDDQQWDSLTLGVGVHASYAISTPWGVIVPQGTATYVHEFLGDQRVVYFRFAEDAGRARFRFKTDPPDRNYGIINVGVVWQMVRDIAPYLNYRVLIGYEDHASHTVTAGLRVQF